MPVTFNANNNYDVEIISDNDIMSLLDNDPLTDPAIVKHAANGERYFEFRVTPTSSAYPLILSNLRINKTGSPQVLTNQWMMGGQTNGGYWNGKPWSIWRPGNSSSGPNLNSQGTNDECTPPITPHDLTPSNLPLWLSNGSSAWRYGTSCPGVGLTPTLLHSTQSAYFIRPLADYAPELLGLGIAWNYMYAIEVYEDDNGVLVNDNLTPDVNWIGDQENDYNLHYGNWPNQPHDYNWILWDHILHSAANPITVNPYPKYIKFFCFFQYNSAIDGGGMYNSVAPGQNVVTDLIIDVDEHEPPHGCTDVNALNYDSNAVVDDGSCQFSGSYTYQITVRFSIASQWNPPGTYLGANTSPGPYTDGSTYSFTVPYPQSQTFSYTTVDWNSINSGIDSHITLLNGALTQDVVLTNLYNPGMPVTEIVQVEVYPITNSGGLIIYDFPGANLGGPNGLHNLPDPNSSDYDDYIQQIFPGWGDSKNNLTAASLRVQGFDDYDWMSPVYQGTGIHSHWHNGNDPTGDQPRVIVEWENAGAAPSGTDYIRGVEQYNPTPSNPARDWFPNKVIISVKLNFTAPHPLSSYSGPTDPFNPAEDMLTQEIQIVHATGNQGDLNWTI